MTDAPKNRWLRPRYNLTTLFVVVTLLACWLGYSMNWIRERHAMRTNWEAVDLVEVSPQIDFSQSGYSTARAPSGLWLLGERGVTHLRVFIRDYDPPRSCESYEVVQRARRLFPEAADVDFGCLHRPEPQ